LSRYFGAAPARTDVPWLVYHVWSVSRADFDGGGEYDSYQTRAHYACDYFGCGVVGAVTGFVSITAVPLTVLASYMIFGRADMSPMMAIWLGMMAIAALLCLVVDVVYVRDVFSSRMNTVFKFYYQVWVIWSVAPLSLRGMCGWLGNGGCGWGWLSWRSLYWRQRWSIRRLQLVKPSFVEQPGSLAGHTPRDDPEGGHESIIWLRVHAPAGSVIVEGVGGQYDIEGKGFGGVSASTGLPTVMGWQDMKINGAVVILKPKSKLLPVIKTCVRFIVVVMRQWYAHYSKNIMCATCMSPTERDVYGEGGLTLFDSIATVAFQQGQITIYEIKK
jgi:hypothetical protein